METPREKRKGKEEKEQRRTVSFDLACHPEAEIAEGPLLLQVLTQKATRMREARPLLPLPGKFKKLRRAGHLSRPK